MHDFTNLQWPEAPFGADQRPFGRRSNFLTAFALDWVDLPSAGGAIPVAAAMIYLRVRRHESPYDIDDQRLSIGFRATVINEVSETPSLLVLLDRALTRARRHAVILAGHGLHDDLVRMTALTTMPLRGVVGVGEAWADRSTKGRGLALMIDTAAEAGVTKVALDTARSPSAVAVPHGPDCSAAAARAVVARAVAIGLTAAVHADRCRWTGTFHIADFLDRSAWDVFAAHRADSSGRRSPTLIEPTRR